MHGELSNYLILLVFDFLGKTLGLFDNFCDASKPGDPVDHCQPTETCVSHIMRLIHE